jgi:molecular chaperone GrpE
MSKPPPAPTPPGDPPPMPRSDVSRADTQGIEIDAVAPEAPPSFDAIGAAAELDAALAGDATDPEADTEAGPATASRRPPVSQRSTTSDSYVALLEAETEELTALVSKKDERIQTLESEAERARARVERAAEKEIEQRTRSLVLGFLDVLDDLDRALTAARQSGVAQPVIEGMELVRKRFLARLGELGVRHVPALGTRFDPNLHEALSVQPTQETEHDGMVIGVMREGYLMGEDTLRPAGVAVAKLSRS